MTGAGETPQPALPGLFEDQGAIAQNTMAFLLRLRARGIAHVGVLRALETVPRLAFVSHRHADLALRDMVLPISCGQTIPDPFAVARILEALDLGSGDRVLEIGTGSGYVTALLSRLAGQVVSYERFQTLALEAQIRLERLSTDNAMVIWGDGLALGAGTGPFDRILVDGLADAEAIEVLQETLANGGVLVAAEQDHDGIKLFRIRYLRGSFYREGLGPWRATPLLRGTAQAL